MRALGQGSVSSFLKTVLGVVYVALWAGVAVIGLLLFAAVLLAFDGDRLARLAGGMTGPMLAGGLLAAGLYVIGVLVVFVLAEVFREGARLRREAELTI